MKPSKNQLRRARKKAQKLHVRSSTNSSQWYQWTNSNSKTTQEHSDTPTASHTEENHLAAIPHAGTTIESSFSPDPNDPLWQKYQEIAHKFDETESEMPSAREPEKPEIYFDDDNDIPDEDQNEPKLSKRKRKELNKLSVAELKAMVRKPEIVEWTDTSAPDPRLLVHIKAHRNVVPVPSHWSLKREYLSSKRGVEKPPFSLPKFIQETGISEMRDAALEKQEQATLKDRKSVV